MFVLNWAIPIQATPTWDAPTWAAPTCRCGRGERSPDADAAGASAVPVQMWQGGEPSPGTDMAGVSPAPVQMWQRCAQSRRRCGSGACARDTRIRQPPLSVVDGPSCRRARFRINGDCANSLRYR